MYQSYPQILLCKVLKPPESPLGLPGWSQGAGSPRSMAKPKIRRGLASARTKTGAMLINRSWQSTSSLHLPLDNKSTPPPSQGKSIDPQNSLNVIALHVFLILDLRIPSTRGVMIREACQIPFEFSHEDLLTWECYCRWVRWSTSKSFIKRNNLMSFASYSVFVAGR